MKQFIIENAGLLSIVSVYLSGMWFSSLIIGLLYGKGFYRLERIWISIMWPFVAVNIAFRFTVDACCLVFSKSVEKFPKIAGFMYILTLPFRPYDIGVILNEAKTKKKPKESFNVSSVWMEDKKDDECRPKIIDLETGKRIM